MSRLEKSAPRIGFITGSTSRLRALGLAAKHRKMLAQDVVYPDVYSLPYFLADRFDFLRDGQRIPPRSYDLIFSELNRSEAQLENVARVIDAGHPVAVIPGPPELLASVLTQRMVDLARHVLDGSRHVLAYSQAAQTLCDGLSATPRSQLIPWPFDYTQTARIGQTGSARRDDAIHVLLSVPIRFTGVTQTYPFVLKSVLQDILSAMPESSARRFRFHTFAYSAEDRAAFSAYGYANGFSIQLERKRGYRSFVRFLAGCDAVINLTPGGVLGRIGFLSAAVGRPAILSDNVTLNRDLYPGSVVPSLDAVALRDRAGSLLNQLVAGVVESTFKPAVTAAESAGDFARNARIFQELIWGTDAAATELLVPAGATL